jgi:hypothetical protein
VTNKMRLGLAVILAPIALLLLVAALGQEQYVDRYFLTAFWVGFPIGMILMVWGFMDLSRGPRKLLATGTLALAKVNEVRRTGSVINEVSLVVVLRLTVEPEGSPAFQATTKTVVPIYQPDVYTPGEYVPVRFDPAKRGRVAIDPNPPAEWLTRVGRPKPSPISQEQILATGSPAIAQIVSVKLTGKTAGQLSDDRTHPERASYPAILIELLVQPEQGEAFSYQAVYAVPPERAASLVRDSLVPVRYVHHAGQPLVAVDWERAGSAASRPSTPFD